MAQRPTHKKCRQCGEWFSFGKDRPLTQKFCSNSCAAQHRANDPKWRKRQSEMMKERADPVAMREKSLAMWRDPEMREYLSEKIRERTNTKKHKAHMKEHNKKMWADPEFRQAHVERTSKMAAEKWTDPDYREKMSALTIEANKKRWADPEFKKKTSFRIRMALNQPLHKKKLSKRMKARMNTPEAKERISKQSKELWENPEYRALVTESSRETGRKSWRNPTFRKNQLTRLRSPEVRKEASERMKARMTELVKDPEWQALMKASWTPERKAKCAEENKKRWADPAFKAKVSAAISKAKKGKSFGPRGPYKPKPPSQEK